MRYVANFPLSASHPLNRVLLATVLDPGGPLIHHKMNPILHGLVVDDKSAGGGNHSGGQTNFVDKFLVISATKSNDYHRIIFWPTIIQNDGVTNSTILALSMKPVLVTVGQAVSERPENVCSHLFTKLSDFGDSKNTPAPKGFGE